MRKRSQIQGADMEPLPASAAWMVCESVDASLRGARAEPAPAGAPRRDGLPRRAWRLLGSMPFAVAILAVVAIAASIGSLVEQNQPFARYVGASGLWWAQIYRALGIDDVYHAPWFLALLSLMTASTALCVWRQTPSMWREARSHRNHLTPRQLRALRHVRVLQADVAPDTWGAGVAQVLRRAGFSWKPEGAGPGSDVSARKGMTRRLGYVLTHLGIVVIGVGGLVDGNLGVQWQRLTGQLPLAPLDLPLAEIPEQSRLSADSGAFRGALRLAPGESASAAALMLGDGQLRREMPLQVTLRRFEILTHPSGQPRDFVSDIDVQDAQGQRRQLRVAMNHPASFDGMTFYQSGFDDGGTRVSLDVLTEAGLAAMPAEVQVGQSMAVLVEGRAMRLEASSWRTHNVVTTSRDEARSAAGALGRTFLNGQTGASSKDLGASLEVAWIDPSGQQSAQTVYQDPIVIDGRPYQVLALHGQDASGQAAPVFLRFPLDAGGQLDTYRLVMARLRDKEHRAMLLRQMTDGVGDADQAQALRASVDEAASRFLDGGFGAFDMPDSSPPAPAAHQRSEPDLGAQTQAHERARRTLIELLSRLALHAWHDIQRDPARADLREGMSFAADSLMVYSQWVEAKRPALLQIRDAKPVAATVLQVTQAPGAGVVFAGMAMLSLGVVLMFLVPERRFWLRTLPDGEVLVALAAHRPMPRLDQELADLCALLQPCLTGTASGQEQRGLSSPQALGVNP